MDRGQAGDPADAALLLLPGWFASPFVTPLAE